MDDQIKITVPDLPEPKRTNLSLKDKRDRLFRLILAVYVFVSAYACIHKILIPFALSFTKLHPGPYTKMDIWVLHPLLTTFLLQKRRDNSFFISFLSGSAIVYGGLEAWEIFQGHYIGWLSFSRLLSSIPFAAMSIILMSRRSLHRSLLMAWMGGLILIPIYYSQYLFPAFTSVTQITPITAKTAVRILPDSDLSACGLTDLRFSKNSTLPLAEEITLSECGLHPSASLVKTNKVQIRNQLKVAANIHLAYFRSGALASAWNVLLLPGQILKRDILIPKDSIAVLYSDTFPDAGVSALAEGPQEKNWSITRRPLKAENYP